MSELRKHFWVFNEGPKTIQQIYEMTSKYGTPENLPYTGPLSDKNRPWLYTVSNTDKGYNIITVQEWHYDGSRLPNRARYTLMYAEKAGQSSTIFADAADAYKSLPEQWKKKLATLVAVMDTGVLRPLVWRHPFNAAKVLQVNIKDTKAIIGLENKETKEVLVYLNDHLKTREFKYVWKENDVVVFDNFSYLHKAARDNGDAERTVHRITTSFKPFDHI